MFNKREDLVNLKCDCWRPWAIRGLVCDNRVIIQVVDRVVFVHYTNTTLCDWIDCSAL